MATRPETRCLTRNDYRLIRKTSEMRGTNYLWEVECPYCGKVFKAILCLLGTCTKSCRCQHRLGPGPGERRSREALGIPRQPTSAACEATLLQRRLHEDEHGTYDLSPFCESRFTSRSFAP